MHLVGADVKSESAKTSDVEDEVEEEEEEEGLPSPPLDEGAFFATPTSMEWSQVSNFFILFRKFFDKML